MLLCCAHRHRTRYLHLLEEWRCDLHLEGNNLNTREIALSFLIDGVAWHMSTCLWTSQIESAVRTRACCGKAQQQLAAARRAISPVKDIQVIASDSQCRRLGAIETWQLGYCSVNVNVSRAINTMLSRPMTCEQSSGNCKAASLRNSSCSASSVQWSTLSSYIDSVTNNACFRHVTPLDRSTISNSENKDAATEWMNMGKLCVTKHKLARLLQ